MLALFALTVILTAVSSPALAGGQLQQASVPGVFDTLEVRADDLSPFYKWQSMLARYAAESKGAADADCSPGSTAPCGYREWGAFLDGIRHASRWRQLLAVNQEMNRHRYISDELNWGVEDFWATPGEFFARSGDCEDFAIVKYFSLKRLGWSDDELRIVAVRDLKLRIGHAVLVAFLDGKVWLLDNQVRQVTDTATISYYQPVYSINEHFWWRHHARS